MVLSACIWGNLYAHGGIVALADITTTHRVQLPPYGMAEGTDLNDFCARLEMGRPRSTRPRSDGHLSAERFWRARACNVFRTDSLPTPIIEFHESRFHPQEAAFLKAA